MSDLHENILQQIVIDRTTFRSLNEDEILELIHLSDPLVVRSSSIQEDQENSNAGRFHSELNVNRENLYSSIHRVFNSYDEAHLSDQVLIQEYLSGTEKSGVLFTVDPNTGSPYFVINYHEGSDTTAITSGTENGQTLVIADFTIDDISRNQSQFDALIQIARRAVEVLDEGPLDIEFAFKDNKIFLLQARPLSGVSQKLALQTFTQSLSNMQEKFTQINFPHPDLLGNATLLSVMADWNPAELIGVRPNQLSISLFRELISDNIWAYERSNYGYRNLRSFPLIVELGGHPYIDYRVSFNSLIPANLSAESGSALAEHYLKKLKSFPHLHDKVEFEVYFANWNLQTSERLKAAGFSSEVSIEIEETLKKLTSQIINSEPYGLKQSVSKTKNLEDRFNAITNSRLPRVAQIYWLIEDCKRHGTLPFAGVARCAFISTDILKSLLNEGYLSERNLDLFFSSLQTVTSKIQNDSSTLDPETFKSKYGHLRPGTFDINSLTYFENYETYFTRGLEPPRARDAFTLDELTLVLRHSGLSIELSTTPEDLAIFISDSITLREEIKFKFSKNISKVLDLLVEIGREYGLSREEMGHVNISTVLSLFKESGSEEDLLKSDIQLGVFKESVSQSLWLPPLISERSDIRSFKLEATQPNFISQDKFSGEVSRVGRDLSGKAVIIESADPGFDWIFLHGIGALITCFGGANSHMAVRCKELGIPAVIGVGEELFKKLIRARSVYLDCANKILELVE
jgi:phosphohistidine swiveling domain-containing protein